MTARALRWLLLVWGGLGAAVILYVIIAASVKPDHPRAINARLLVGEMADFAIARPPRPAPMAPFEFEGREMTFSDFRGKALLVNFWATWCAPCVRELPSLGALQAQLGGEDFEVVAIAADVRGPEAAARFLERLEVRNLKLYADPRLRLMSEIGGANVLPVSILIDREGREIGRIVGEADWTSPEAIALVRAAMTG